MIKNCCLQNGHVFQTVRVCTGYIYHFVCGHKNIWLIIELISKLSSIIQNPIERGGVLKLYRTHITRMAL